MKKYLYVILFTLSSQLAAAETTTETTIDTTSETSREFENDTIWEIGAGITAVNLPLYPGSSEDDSLVFPLPILRIQSKYLEVDDGIRGFLYQSPSLRLNVSADLGVPVNSTDSTIRQGMPDLNAVIQIGPSLEFIFAGGRKQASELRLELPLRSAIATDLSHTENAGWILEPRITYETLRPFKTGFAYQISSGLRYASEEYHAYYYDVPEAFATAQRPAFQADGGYSGYFLDLVGNWRTEDFIYFVFARYQNLSGAEYADSPLVEEKNYLALGAGFIWMFAGSE